MTGSEFFVAAAPILGELHDQRKPKNVAIRVIR